MPKPAKKPMKKLGLNKSAIKQLAEAELKKTVGGFPGGTVSVSATGNSRF